MRAAWALTLGLLGGCESVEIALVAEGEADNSGCVEAGQCGAREFRVCSSWPSCVDTAGPILDEALAVEPDLESALFGGDDTAVFAWIASRRPGSSLTPRSATRTPEGVVVEWILDEGDPEGEAEVRTWAVARVAGFTRPLLHQVAVRLDAAEDER